MRTDKESTTHNKAHLEHIIQLLAELNPNNDILGYGFSDDNMNGKSAVQDYFNSITEMERIKIANKVLQECRGLEDLIYEYIIKDIENRANKSIKEYNSKCEQLITEGISRKKSTFTVKEVITISQKSRNTIYKHLKDGTLKGIQDKQENWTIKREALEEYLNRNDF